LNAGYSFEGKYGSITYTADAKLDIPWAFDKHVEVAFTVINNLNLNSLPDLRSPKTATAKKEICCFCCKGGKINIELCLQKGIVSKYFCYVDTVVDI
jgi:hypothetical protein